MKSVQRGLKSAAMVAALTVASTAFASPIMWVDDASGNLGTVDAATGQVDLVGPMGVVMTDIAFSPSGQLFGVDFSSLYIIDTHTGAATFIGNLGQAGANANALVFGTDGTLYMAGNTSTDLYTVNITTGQSTSLGSFGFNSGGDLAFHGGTLFLASTTNELVQIDLDNLANSFAVGPFGVSNVFGLATAHSGNMYAVAGTDIYTVDPLTGALSNQISFAGQGLGIANGEAFFEEAVATVPEPGDLSLFGLGLLGILFFWRRRAAAR